MPILPSISPLHDSLPSSPHGHTAITSLPDESAIGAAPTGDGDLARRGVRALMRGADERRELHERCAEHGHGDHDDQGQQWADKPLAEGTCPVIHPKRAPVDLQGEGLAVSWRKGVLG